MDDVPKKLKSTSTELTPDQEAKVLKSLDKDFFPETLESLITAQDSALKEGQIARQEGDLITPEPSFSATTKYLNIYCSNLSITGLTRLLPPSFI